MIKVLHVTAHLGGGIGKVLSGIANYERKFNQDVYHTILTLEETQNPHFKDICADNGIDVFLAKKTDIPSLINRHDIVQIEWWHHPLTMQFMYHYLPQLPCRLMVWSHISGCTYPCIPSSFVDLPDKFIFASPYSYENSFWTEIEKNRIREFTSVIVSSGNNFKPIERIPHQGFNIGYVGFLGYSKIHSQFVKFCEEAAEIKEVYFTIVGDMNLGEELVNDIKRSWVHEKVNFTGYCTNISNILGTFDVFGYPLNPEHTGTAENALLEAMAAGVTPIVLKQCSEQFTVEHQKTGLVVESIEEYKNAVRWLYNNPTECRKLGEAAAEYVRNTYNIDKTCQELDLVYESLLSLPKSLHKVGNVFGHTPYDWFCSCFKGDLGNIKGIAAGDNKSGLGQYKKYFNLK